MIYAGYVQVRGQAELSGYFLIRMKHKKIESKKKRLLSNMNSYLMLLKATLPTLYIYLWA